MTYAKLLKVTYFVQHDNFTNVWLIESIYSFTHEIKSFNIILTYIIISLNL